jgi:hypothetical protein
MKRILLLLAIALLFITCKKDASQVANPPVSEIIGNWATYSYSSNFGKISVTANEYPCLEKNLIEIKKDQTFTTTYVGKDSCWITPPTIIPLTIRTGTVFGIPGEPSYTGTWRQDGIKLYFGPGHTSTTLSKVDNKMFLTSIDTIVSSNIIGMAIYTIVWVKK